MKKGIILTLIGLIAYIAFYFLFFYHDSNYQILAILLFWIGVFMFPIGVAKLLSKPFYKLITNKK